MQLLQVSIPLQVSVFVQYPSLKLILLSFHTTVLTVTKGISSVFAFIKFLNLKTNLLWLLVACVQMSPPLPSCPARKNGFTGGKGRGGMCAQARVPEF